MNCIIIIIDSKTFNRAVLSILDNNVCELWINSLIRFIQVDILLFVFTFVDNHEFAKIL